ncbi:MAG: SLBB domain-containing protein [Bacteroidota bacterium]
MKRILFLIVILFTSMSFAQSKDYDLGSNLSLLRSSQQTGFFDLSDPETINIYVSVWGWVRYPGKYKIPINTDVSDLLSYAGGPLEGADLEDIRIVRVDEDSTQRMIKFSFNDVMYETKLQNRFRKVPRLDAGDVLVVPGEPKLYFRDHFSIWMSVISMLISLSILALNIIKG